MYEVADEVFLDHDQCQSRILGHVGSSACTIISTMTVGVFLRGEVPCPQSANGITADLQQNIAWLWAATAPWILEHLLLFKS